MNLLGAAGLLLGDRIRAATEAAIGLGPAAPAALVALDGHLAGRSIEELRRALAMTHSGTVRLVDRLEDAGLVTRTPGADGRTRALHVTEAGAQAARRVLTVRGAELRGALRALTQEQRDALLPALEALLGGLTTAGADPWRTCRLCDAAACGHDEGRCPVTEAGRRTG